MTHPHPLHPHTLAQAPELATLALLDAVAFLATRVLVAEHPTLDHEYCPKQRRMEPPTLRQARRILRRLYALQDALADYRLAVIDALAPPPERDDDFDLSF